MFRLNSSERQCKRLFLITGANSGLGYETSKFLLEKGATVIMCCRDLQKGERAKEDLLKFNYSGNIELIEFKIFNRWGNLVFETNNKEEAWDGKRRGEDQNSGTYIYYIKGRKSSGEITEIKGNFTLLR